LGAEPYLFQEGWGSTVGVELGQAADEPLQLGGGGQHRGRRGKPSDPRRRERCQRGPTLVDYHGKVEADVVVGILEARRHDPHDTTIHAAQVEDPAHCIRISPEKALPQSVTEHHDGFSVSESVLLRE
jgi:hypothetical protein